MLREQSIYFALSDNFGKCVIFFKLNLLRCINVLIQYYIKAVFMLIADRKIQTHQQEYVFLHLENFLFSCQI